MNTNSAAAAAKARSQSPYISYRDHPFDDDDDEDLEDGSERRGRSVSRSSSIRKRDDSWDKKWKEQVRKNSEGSKTLKAEVNPGKLDFSTWEKRTKNTEVLPPKTPPSFRKKLVRASPAPEEEFRKTRREETPPLPPQPSRVSREKEESPPLPLPPMPDPCRSPTPTSKAKKKLVVRATKSPSPAPDRLDTNSDKTDPDWKTQVRKNQGPLI